MLFCVVTPEPPPPPPLTHSNLFQPQTSPPLVSSRPSVSMSTDNQTKTFFVFVRSGTEPPQILSSVSLLLREGGASVTSCVRIFEALCVSASILFYNGPSENPPPPRSGCFAAACDVTKGRRPTQPGITQISSKTSCFHSLPNTWKIQIDHPRS